MARVRMSADTHVQHLTDVEWKALGHYVRYCADAMGLRDWSFVLARRYLTDTSAIASIDITYGKREALIKIADDFRSLCDERIRESICHELIHCHLDQVEYIVPA